MSRDKLRVHITGASGTGTTTLGVALADAMGLSHFDTDDFYWSREGAPYSAKAPVKMRLELIGGALRKHPRSVLTGSFVSWGQPLTTWFDLVIFLRVPTETRLERLAARERERFGDAIDPGGDRHDLYQAFMEWARGYDDGDGTSRSLVRHESWLATLECPVLRLGDTSVEQRVEQVAAFVESMRDVSE